MMIFKVPITSNVTQYTDKRCFRYCPEGNFHIVQILVSFTGMLVNTKLKTVWTRLAHWTQLTH